MQRAGRLLDLDPECRGHSRLRDIPINTNFFVGTVVVGTLLTHLAILGSIWFWPPSIRFLPMLNLLVAGSVLSYGLTRARYILGTHDWPQLGLMGFECLVLLTALGALRESRWAMIASCVAFAIHGCVSIAAVIFVSTFRMKRLF